MGSIGSKYGSTVVQQQDLNNKVAIVTGPTTGIGYQTSLMLASVGCHVVLAGRGESRLEKVASDMTQQLAKSHPNLKPRFTSIDLDLSNFSSIHQFVTRFQETNLPCHYLFNNAGVMMTDYLHTADGFELQLGTNCIGHQYLTNRLMSILIASSTPTTPARVINTSSDAHKMSNYNVNGGEAELKQKLYPEEKDYDRYKWYGHSKVGNIWYSRELTRRYASQGVISIAAHPGLVATELGKQAWHIQFIYKGFGWAMKSSNQGAATQLWAAFDTEWPKQIHDTNFPFYSKDCHIQRTSRLGWNQTFDKLWYDFNEREIARVATQHGFPLGATSTATSTAPSTTPADVPKPVDSQQSDTSVPHAQQQTAA